MTVMKYFGYGSNMDFAALTAKGVIPLASRKAKLNGWRLRFNLEHFFRHEGGVGNIEQTGSPSDVVQGVLHECNDGHLAALDKLEGRGVGYDRIEVPVETTEGVERAYTYVGRPLYLNEACLPTKRYLTILVRGANQAGLDPEYIAALNSHPVLPAQDHPPFAAQADLPVMDHAALEWDQTVLAGHVFHMKDVRPAHELARTWFGGKDVTQFHLRRMDSSTGTEALADYLSDRLSAYQQSFLNTYLHAFDEEYELIGNFNYAHLPAEKIMV
ncbi:MAG: gamma-glutamylcyclotransferase family protein [Pseudomonadota bacterium]